VHHDADDHVGLAYGSVRVVDSDPAWPEIFTNLAGDLRQALGSRAAGIEHVGSTAVPGLAAKPIIDIAVLLAPHAAPADVISALESAGYRFRGDKGDAGGLLFVLEDRPARRVAHVHAVADVSQWQRYLAVRDRLRSDSTARAAYTRLKRTLAALHPDDRQSYTAAKASFVAALAAGPPMRP